MFNKKKLILAFDKKLNQFKKEKKANLLLLNKKKFI
jgi:hypothetical protein